MTLERRRKAFRFGRTAESLAVAMLWLKGYRVLARGWRHPAGEIDIVARRNRTIIFVEVKGRRVDALEPVGPRQQRRIVRAAGAFLAAHPEATGCDLRFDVVLIAPRRLPRHIADAWRPEADRAR